MTNRVEFVDLKRQYARIKDEVDAAMSAVIHAGAFVGGQAVEEFEKNFARYCETEYAVAVANGTDALHLALLALGVGPGDEVITVSHTFIATVASIVQVGAQPVLADINPDTYGLEPSTLEKYITPRTKAIIPVHIYGHPTDMAPIMEIAERHNLFVLEDACQAHGARYKGQRAGSLGHIAAFSFYPGKNLGAYGDGGAITTNDASLAERVKTLRNHGGINKYQHEVWGYNSRLDGVQAAVLNVKLRYLDEWNARRREIAQLYAKLLANVPDVIVPAEAEWAEPVYHLYVIRTGQRSKLQATLSAEGIATGIHYPIPVHKQPSWIAKFGQLQTSQELVEKYADEILSLPMHPDMTDEEVHLVADVIAATVNSPAVVA